MENTQLGREVGPIRRAPQGGTQSRGAQDIAAPQQDRAEAALCCGACTQAFLLVVLRVAHTICKVDTLPSSPHCLALLVSCEGQSQEGQPSTALGECTRRWRRSHRLVPKCPPAVLKKALTTPSCRSHHPAEVNTQLVKDVRGKGEGN